MNSAYLQIAQNTFRSFSRDRIFVGAIVLSLLIILFTNLLGMISVVEKRKIMLDFSFVAISFCDVVFAIVLGVLTISREIKTKNIYTVIAKPLSRISYVLGTFLGLSAILLVSHLILVLALCFVLFSGGFALPNGLFWCLGLIYLEAVLVLAIALLFSFTTNAVLASTFTVILFLCGRSSYTLVLLAEKSESSFYRGVYKLVHSILPDLLRFDIRSLVAYGKEFPIDFVYWGGLYFLLYSAVCLVLGCLVFQRRNIP